MTDTPMLKHCSRCGQKLQPPGLGLSSRVSSGAEIWTCPDHHEAWSWSHRMNKWLREPNPPPIPVKPEPFHGAGAESTPCVKCGARMVLRSAAIMGHPRIRRG
jgi:hypothetical protein